MGLEYKQWPLHAAKSASGERDYISNRHTAKYMSSIVIAADCTYV